MFEKFILISMGILLARFFNTWWFQYDKQLSELKDDFNDLNNYVQHGQKLELSDDLKDLELNNMRNAESEHRKLLVSPKIRKFMRRRKIIEIRRNAEAFLILIAFLSLVFFYPFSFPPSMPDPSPDHVATMKESK